MAKRMAIGMVLGFIGMVVWMGCTQTGEESPLAGKEGVRAQGLTAFQSDLLELKRSRDRSADFEAEVRDLVIRHGFPSTAAEEVAEPFALDAQAKVALTTPMREVKNYRSRAVSTDYRTIDLAPGQILVALTKNSQGATDPTLVAFLKESSGDAQPVTVVGWNDDSIGVDPKVLWTNGYGTTKTVHLLTYAATPSTRGQTDLSITVYTNNVGAT